MKPTKNRMFCKDCGRTKMLFETEKKAEGFIKFNSEEIEEISGYSPQRSYYCLFCGGWHVTSIKETFGLSKKEQLFAQYQQEEAKKKEEKVINQSKIILKKLSETEKQNNEKTEEFELKIKDMNDTEKDIFFSENIEMLKKDIELLRHSNSDIDKSKVKDFRKTLEILYVVRKQHGLQDSVIKHNKKLDELREQNIEAWRLWAAKNGYDDN